VRAADFRGHDVTTGFDWFDVKSPKPKGSPSFFVDRDGFDKIISPISMSTLYGWATDELFSKA